MQRSRLSFTQACTRLVDALKRSNGFQSRLARLEYKDACDALLQVVRTEDDAMAHAEAPPALDILTLMANLHNLTTVDALRRRVRDGAQRLRAHGSAAMANVRESRRRPVTPASLRDPPVGSRDDATSGAPCPQARSR